jgi:hypothetical protein
MKAHIVYDRQGNVISMGVPLPQSYDFRGPAFGPHARDGQLVGEFDVPEEHAQLQITDLVNKLKVDVQGKSHKLVAKP